MFVLGDLMEKEKMVTSSSPNGLPGQGEEERSQMIGWDPKTEVRK